jgi:MtaA/CmuA family methyltransferase
MDSEQRLLLTLIGESKGLPVICPGGMMSMVYREAGEDNNPVWSQAHTDANTMARIAGELAQATGFENVGVPFCVTVEAEALGGRVDLGDARVEPRIVDYILDSPAALGRLRTDGAASRGRMPVVLEAISILKQARQGLPIIGNLTGPVSLATSLMDPNLFLRSMVKDRPFVRELLARLTEFIATFGEAQVKAGADVVSIGDPTASGEILGPDFFGEYVATSLQTIIGRIKKQGGRTILHICGDISSILGYLRPTGADALSFDASMSIGEVREKVGDWVLMGNVSTFLLTYGPVSRIVKATRRVVIQGIDIVSPACGLGTGTPAKNIRAMTDTVRSIREPVDGRREVNEPG